MEIHKRTFKAKFFDSQSEERKELNKSAITSEYMASHKFALIGDKFSATYRSREEAESAKTRLSVK